MLQYSDALVTNIFAVWQKYMNQKKKIGIFIFTVVGKCSFRIVVF